MATKQQVPVLAARLVEFQEEFLVLPIDDAQWVIMNGKEAAALCAKAIFNRQKGILRLVSGDSDLKLKASDGSRLIYNADDIFKHYINPDFVNLTAINSRFASAEMSVQVHKTVGDGTFMEIFKTLPGSWEQKWLPQDKVVDFCKTLSHLLRRTNFLTFFLIKKDENKPIDEKNPGDNLLAVEVDIYNVGLSVNFSPLEHTNVWMGAMNNNVVSPKLMHLKI